MDDQIPLRYGISPVLKSFTRYTVSIPCPFMKYRGRMTLLWLQYPEKDNALYCTVYLHSGVLWVMGLFPCLLALNESPAPPPCPPKVV